MTQQLAPTSTLRIDSIIPRLIDLYITGPLLLWAHKPEKFPGTPPRSKSEIYRHARPGVLGSQFLGRVLGGSR